MVEIKIALMVMLITILFFAIYFTAIPRENLGSSTH